jgi:hypothetical protein
VTPEEIVREVASMQTTDRLAAADLALNWALDMLEVGRSFDVDSAMRSINVESAPLGVLVAWLTGTLQTADVSAARAEFFERVRTRVERDEPGRVKGLLGGLGPSGAEGARWGHAMIAALTLGGES